MRMTSSSCCSNSRTMPSTKLLFLLRSTASPPRERTRAPRNGMLVHSFLIVSFTSTSIRKKAARAYIKSQLLVWGAAIMMLFFRPGGTRLPSFQPVIQNQAREKRYQNVEVLREEAMQEVKLPQPTGAARGKTRKIPLDMAATLLQQGSQLVGFAEGVAVADVEQLGPTLVAERAVVPQLGRLQQQVALGFAAGRIGINGQVQGPLNQPAK